jgi:membrane protein DedA with SNARE-associated domain
VLAAQHKLEVSPAWIAACGSAGAIVGDSMGFALGRRFGTGVFGWLGRKLPAHFGPAPVAAAERIFASRGAWAVFFGRFIAILRILAGPLAGALKMPYGRFLAANACGGIVWAAGMTYLIWFLGAAAGQWLSRLSWLGLVLAAAAGVTISLLVRRKINSLAGQAQTPAEPAADDEAPAESPGPGSGELLRHAVTVAPAGRSSSGRGRSRVPA